MIEIDGKTYYRYCDVCNEFGLTDYEVRKAIKNFNISKKAAFITLKKTGNKRRVWTIESSDVHRMLKLIEEKNNRIKDLVNIVEYANKNNVNAGSVRNICNLEGVKKFTIDNKTYFSKEDIEIVDAAIKDRVRVYKPTETQEVKEKGVDHPYLLLAGTIVKMAVDEYIEHLIEYNMFGDERLKKKITVDEKWFNSKIFKVYTMGKINPKYIIKEAKSIAREKEKEREEKLKRRPKAV